MVYNLVANQEIKIKDQTNFTSTSIIFLIAYQHNFYTYKHFSFKDKTFISLNILSLNPFN